MKTVWLSHIITKKTPLYGGADDIDIRPDKQIIKGDSCNTSVFEFPSHTGTHMDAPYHFLSNGKTIDAYTPGAFIYNSPVVVDVAVPQGRLISPGEMNIDLPADTDLILIRTGFEKWRGTKHYWNDGPGLAPELMESFLGNCPDLRAVGMDFISISSLKHRETGRKAHHAFLDRNILLIEDMHLESLAGSSRLSRVIALPVRFHRGDGSPCTIVGYMDE